MRHSTNTKIRWCGGILIGLLLTPLCCYAQTSERRLLEELNELRSEGCMCGQQQEKPVGKLKWDAQLAGVAYDYAVHLYHQSQQNPDHQHVYLSHVSSDGSTLQDRLEAVEYYAKVAVENIAYITGNEEMVIDYWLNNPTSCSTLMNRKVSRMGSGHHRGFWVLILAKPQVVNPTQPEGLDPVEINLNTSQNVLFTH